MTRRSFFSVLTAFIAAIAVNFLANTEHATAQKIPPPQPPQNLNICYYIVDIAGIAPHCFPIDVVTEWACPDGSIKLDLKNYNFNGVFMEPLNPGGFPPCPPACRFNWGSLNPPLLPTVPGNSTVFNIGNCCYILTVEITPAGEVRLIIRPCPADTVE